MNRSILYSLLLGLVMLLGFDWFLGFVDPDFVEYRPLLLIFPSAIFLIVIVVKYLRISIKIKNGSFVSIGRRKSRYYNLLIFAFIGALWVFTPYLKSEIVLTDDDTLQNICVGICWLFCGIYNYDKSFFLLKENSMIYDDFMYSGELRFKKINKLVYSDKSLFFMRRHYWKEINLDSLSDAEIESVKTFLSNKLQERFVVE